MATLTLPIYKFKVSGVLTDVTTCKLSDDTGSYGVIRLDTGVLVVADGADMTRIAAGQYAYSFTKPAENLTYRYWVEAVYAGRTYRRQYDYSDSAAATATTAATTLAAQLLNVQTAIEQVELYGQSVSDDGESLTRGDLRALYAREQRLLTRIHNSSYGGVSVAEF